MTDVDDYLTGVMADVEPQKRDKSMDKTLIVRGHSDDIVYVDHNSKIMEFYPPEDGCYIGTSNGLLARITYDGMWNIRRISGDPPLVEYHRATNEDDDYSDILRVAQVEWFVLGHIND